MNTVSAFLSILILSVLSLVATSVQAQAAVYQFDLPAQPLAEALRAIGRQTNKNILFDPALVEGISAPALRAELTVSEAVNQLLSGTKLSTESVPPDTVLIKRGKSASSNISTPLSTATPERHQARMAQTAAVLNSAGQEMSSSVRAETGHARKGTGEPSDAMTAAQRAMPEILVTGSKLLNMDLRRSRDDIQPYVTFNREAIASSGAMNTEEFLKQRLTMNTVAQTQSQSPGSGIVGTTSSINLRGLGSTQTLILIDGHRVSGTTFRSRSRNKSQYHTESGECRAREQPDVPRSRSRLPLRRSAHPRGDGARNVGRCAAGRPRVAARCSQCLQQAATARSQPCLPVVYPVLQRVRRSTSGKLLVVGP